MGSRAQEAQVRRGRAVPATGQHLGKQAMADPGPQLPRSQAAVPMLDRAGRRIQRLDHAQPATQLADRSQARVRRQGPGRRAGPHLLTPPAASTYPAHR